MGSTINFYKTSDYQLAVTLYALGKKLASMDMSNPNRAIFQFEDDGTISDCVDDFFNDRLRLNPRQLLNSSKLVKSRLYVGI